MTDGRWQVTSAQVVPGVVAAWWTDASCEASVGLEPVFLVVEESTTQNVVGEVGRRTRVSYTDAQMNVKQELVLGGENPPPSGRLHLDPYVWIDFMMKRDYDALVVKQEVSEVDEAAHLVEVRKILERAHEKQRARQRGIKPKTLVDIVAEDDVLRQVAAAKSSMTPQEANEELKIANDMQDMSGM